MKRFQKVALGLLVACLGLQVNLAKAQSSAEEKLGWQLGAQAWTFRMSTFAETLDTLNQIGLKYVQAFPNQKIGGGIEGNMDFRMDASKRQQVLDMLKKKGIKMVSFGVTGANTESDWKQLFEFAKGMGLQSIATEPDPKFMPLIGQLADEYQINVAIHNHPRPTRYWSPDTVLKYLGSSKRIGVNADIGHWVRSGLDPVECLKKFQGRIFALHFKDLNEKPSAEILAAQAATGEDSMKALREMMGKGPHDVHWGQGVSNIAGSMKELKRQGFKGPIFVEYEYNWGKNAKDVDASVKYFRSVAKKM